MRNTVVIVIFFVLAFHVNAQIEVDEPIEKKIVKPPIPYDGSFMKFPHTIDEDVALGMIGEKVTFMRISTNAFINEDGSRVSVREEDKFKNKTFEIISYEKHNNDYFLVTNETGTFKWEVGITQEYVFNKFITAIKEKLLNKILIPLYDFNEIEALDGRSVKINGSDEYKVTNVSYSKYSAEYTSKYIIKVQLNNEFDVIYPTGEYDQPREHNGEKFISNPGWINLIGDARLSQPFALIEKPIYEEFKSINSRFLTQIRSRNVILGMSEKQCRWAWGPPVSTVFALSGLFNHLTI
jgi:hypothetical protein